MKTLDRQKLDVVNKTRSNPALRDWHGAADCVKFQNLPLFEPHKVYAHNC